MEHAIKAEVYLYLTINGKEIPFITDAVISMWVVMAIIITAAFFMARNLKEIPEGAQSAGEFIIDFMHKFSGDQIGHRASVFVPFLTTLIMFLGVSNMVSVLNIVPSGSFLAAVTGNPELEEFHYSLHPPTRNFNVTIALAFITMSVVVFSEFKYGGFKGWLRGFYKPSPLFGFIKVLDYFSRPLSLCFRLFGNILGGVIVMTLAYSAIPGVFPTFVGMYFELFDGGLQAFVFVFLTSLYIGEAVEGHG